MEALESKQVYANPWFSVREDLIRRPDGSTGPYSVVEGPDVAVIVPMDGDRFHLVEQYRHPVGARRWEFPAGTLDEGEDVAALAERELREETGLVAASLTHLGTFDSSPGTLTQRCSAYLATGLTEGEHAREPEEQDMEAAWFTRAEVERMILDGTLCDAKSLAAYTLLLLRDAG
ncbi:8-oxo-dGTP pyrophosphatase MutT (NUDIX family) [Nocardioides thalensis]|uniref:8-oxo-dGTP pyrophosphatase MutT (NUDIX family) n=1 Tax=Nocardioides thalensis TaxID=1914755 RepID=A0A853C5P9_9ACTN|nr:8-oxo-dGTP pyrophosphatase MutT (NUDIX family) [Nocardioides thalensis]